MQNTSDEDQTRPPRNNDPNADDRPSFFLTRLVTLLLSFASSSPRSAVMHSQKGGPEARSGAVGAYVDLLLRPAVRRAILLAWLALLAGGAFGVIKVFPALKLEITPIPGDTNDQAKTALVGSFGSALQQEWATLVLLTSTDGSDLRTSPAAAAASARLSAFAAPYISSGLLAAGSGTTWFDYNSSGMVGSAEGTVNAGGDAMIVTYTTTIGYFVNTDYNNFLADLRDLAVAVQGASGGKFKAEPTGGLVLAADSGVAILSDISTSDSVTVTLSFLVLAFALRSLRLSLVALVSLCGAFGFTYLLVWPLTTALSTPNFTTSLVISTLVSLSLDYNLFALSHVKRALGAGATMADAVEGALRSPGHTVVVSGATLASCFLVLAIFPASIVRAPGIATAFAVVCSVLATLTLTPALLLTFPAFWAKAAAEPVAPAGGGDDGPPPPPQPPQQQPRSRRVRALARLDACDPWPRVALATRAHKYGLTLFLIALFVAPFAYRLPHFNVSQDLRNILPRDAPSVEAYYRFEAVFGAGATSKAQLLGVASGGAAGSALTPAFFASAAAAVAAVLAVSPAALLPQNVSGLAWNTSGGGGGAPADAAAVASNLAAAAGCPTAAPAACRAAGCSAAACELALRASSTLSPDGRAMLLPLSLRIDRGGDDGVAWANNARAALLAVNAAGGEATWRLSIDPSADTVAWIYGHLGLLFGVTVAVVTAIVAVGFRSVLIALRCVLSLAVMEVCVWGAATAVYVDGVLNPGGVLHTMDNATGLFWLMPLLAFSLITGLGLDYDIFLLTSITEERAAGWGDEDAVALGVMRSGPIISYAGFIMAIAYSGFLFSDIPLLNQLGFFIVFAVLIDTFVIRPLLVPAMMNIAGKWNWWPCDMPAPSRGPLQVPFSAAASAAAHQASIEASPAGDGGV